MKYPNVKEKKSAGEKKGIRNRVIEPRTTSNIQMGNIELSRRKYFQDKF